jgi:hypothetical protein
MSINYEERRKFVRFPKNVPIRFFDKDATLGGNAETHDVSARGLRFGTSVSLNTNAYIDIWLYVPGCREPIFTQGRVTWASMVGPNWYHIGVDLVQADFVEMERIVQGYDK